MHACTYTHMHAPKLSAHTTHQSNATPHSFSPKHIYDTHLITVSTTTKKYKNSESGKKPREGKGDRERLRLR
ncbi:hypothetical protein Sjap_003644 [Stephania japonica]|uniref:Uncharacterized protein n=1 Tax=Stephania japonica TaxID=461633 RepID=A0AAP0KRL3_9MAGN